MDIKYNITRLKDSSVKEVKDSVSVEEPLEMNLRYKSNGTWKMENLSITMRTPGHDEDLISGFYLMRELSTILNKLQKLKNKEKKLEIIIFKIK